VRSRTRALSFGICALLAIAGVACAAAVPGLTGDVLAIVLLGIAAAAAALLVFLEIGLGEERDRERERRR